MRGCVRGGGESKRGCGPVLGFRMEVLGADSGTVWYPWFVVSSFFTAESADCQEHGGLRALCGSISED